MQNSSENGKEKPYIWVSEFTEKSAKEFREQVLDRADRDGANVIPIYIDSYGGAVDALSTMLETMEETPNKFITIAIGKAVSCGAILLSNGDMRFAGNFSRIMVHNISSVTYGDVTAIKADSDELNRLNQIFMGLLAKNCGMSYSTLQSKIKESTDSKDLWFSPEAAIKFGIIDHVGMPELVPHVQWGCGVVLPKQEAQSNKKAKKTTKTKQ